MKKIIYAGLFLFLSALLLLYPRESLHFSLTGLDLWFRKMIPALFPFMIISGIMIRMDLTDKIMLIAKPILKPLFRLRGAPLYAITVGFLCGFPMGARVAADLYERKQISKDEATYLLAFVNNIGPLYFLSFALPLLRLPATPALVFGMYGIPLCYGLFLRHSAYRHKITSVINMTLRRPPPPVSLTRALDDSITAAIENITKLGGYMVFFNLLSMIPYLLFHDEKTVAVIAGLMEITGGLGALKNSAPAVSLILLTAGGLSCLAQTFSCLAKTDLSLKNYIVHKLILTAIAGGYYWLLFTV